MLKKLLQQSPLFIALIPVFYLLHLLNDYFGYITFRHLLLKEALLLLAIPVAVFFLVNRLSFNKRKYALVILFVELIYFFYTSIQETTAKVSLSMSTYSYLLPILFVFFLMTCWLVYQIDNAVRKFFLFFNTVFLVFIIYEIGHYTLLNVTQGAVGSLFEKNSKLIRQYRTCDTCSRPDIYFLVFDSYAGNAVLKEYWDYDNSALENFFKENEFFFIPNSTSNYNSTAHSISSELNMDYHPSSRIRKLTTLDFINAMHMVRANNVCGILEKQGYSFYNYSIFPLAQDPMKLKPFSLTNADEIIVSQTLGYRFITDIGWNFGLIKNLELTPEKIRLLHQVNLEDLQRINETFKGVRSVLADTSSKPKFVYAHFLLPHDPYFFDSTGKLLSQQEWLEPKSSKDRYLQQLIYTNTLIQSLVLELKNEKREKIILVQSDHGYRFLEKDYPIEWMFQNLNAIYLPNKDYSLFYDSLSNVNTFRIIFNQYFNGSFPLLKDSSVYFKLW